MFRFFHRYHFLGVHLIWWALWTLLVLLLVILFWAHQSARRHHHEAGATKPEVNTNSLHGASGGQ